MGQLKGAAAHAWVFEQNCAQRLILQSPQVAEATTQKRQGEDTAREDYRLLGVEKNHLSNDSKLSLRQAQQSAL